MFSITLTEAALADSPLFFEIIRERYHHGDSIYPIMNVIKDEE